jgi:hypothetical protein
MQSTSVLRKAVPGFFMRLLFLDDHNIAEMKTLDWLSTYIALHVTFSFLKPRNCNAIVMKDITQRDDIIYVMKEDEFLS